MLSFQGAKPYGDWYLLAPAVDLLKKDGVVAYPTETVYGLGASMVSERAVQRIFDIKGREKTKPISLMVDSVENALALVSRHTAAAEKLISVYWPGPLTLVFQASNKVPAYLRSSGGKVGIRMPDHPLSVALTKQLGQPITSTSANRSGEPPATRAEEVARSLADDVDLIIAAGASPIQRPSTVVDVSEPRPRLLRAGAISFSSIEETLKEGPDGE